MKKGRFGEMIGIMKPFFLFATGIEDCNPTDRAVEIFRRVLIFAQKMRNKLRLKRVANFPVMAEWIDNPSQTPAIIFLNRNDLSGSSRNRPGEDGIRISHGQDHPNSATAQGFRTEVGMLRRLVRNPKFRTFNGQPRYHRAAWILDAKDFGCSECRFVEFNRSRSISN